MPLNLHHQVFNVIKLRFLHRTFLQDVIEETLAEVINKNTFDSLVNAVTMEKEKKAKLQQTILK